MSNIIPTHADLMVTKADEVIAHSLPEHAYTILQSPIVDFHFLHNTIFRYLCRYLEKDTWYYHWPRWYAHELLFRVTDSDIHFILLYNIAPHWEDI